MSTEESRRRRHNEAEIRRRQRIREQLDRLASVLGNSGKDQLSILTDAAAMLRLQEQWLELLRREFTQQLPTFEKNSDFERLFCNASVAIALLEVNGRFLDCNPQFEVLMGYTRKEIRQESCFSLAKEDSMSKLFEVFRNLLEGESRLARIDKECRRKDGSYLQMNITIHVVRDPESKRPASFCVYLVPRVDAFKQDIRPLQYEQEIRLPSEHQEPLNFDPFNVDAMFSLMNENFPYEDGYQPL